MASLASVNTGNVMNLVRRQFQAAMASKDLVFAPSTTTRIDDNGIQFDILHAPAFAIKPGPAPPAPPSGPRKPFNPFLPPQPELLVGQANDDYNVVMNKFTVIENHILLTTKGFKQQSCVLDRSELGAMWSLMQGYGPDAFGFHNNGLASGASVAHRHLQVLPYKMPLTAAVEAHVRSNGIKPYAPFQLPSLPFHHVLAPIPPKADLADLHVCYVKLMELALGADGVRKLNEVDVGYDMGFVPEAPGSNLMLTPSWIFVVPRTEPRPGIHIHSMGLSGLIVATTEEEIEFVKKTGPLNILKNAGVPKKPLTKL
ncbi:hypothetical protein DFJ74DRAFT_681256 [Hyaloraphidium curvatum]|nr:hypothetical protein DFJ74DRAFT_681256 [Hyaloraphidium curvatum]